ncbi:heme o synthase [Bacillus chungangensis]|uniref:Protoheme IX farnesyltransferase n=1 Tax=Bacillus chungangensis TaxID=587633 RepID=A0ABT9WUZ0_9BACI|nr:heme o synthase [Bacillus chungangensis]MDQ0177029.1 protoheme IX farnesyltransferase [Bacillus chungangensis]
MSNSRAMSEVKETMGVKQTMTWKEFMALIKIGIVNSNLITIFTGMWLAFQFTDKHFLQSLDTVLYTLLGTAFILAGASSLNNYIDRDIDPIMERTKNRPSVTGKISGRKVLAIGLSFVTIGTILLFLTTAVAAIIGIIGVFSYVVVYSMWSKRIHVSNTVVGSIGGAMPPLIGWAAIEPNLGMIPWMLYLIMFIWQPPHFYALAMRRVEEYRAAGIPMLPVVKGFAVTKRHIVAWVACLLPIPFFLLQLGTPIVILMTILNLGWLILGIRGFKMKDDIKWATMMFIYSLNYLTILFVAIVIVTAI